MQRKSILEKKTEKINIFWRKQPRVELHIKINGAMFILNRPDEVKKNFSPRFLPKKSFVGHGLTHLYMKPQYFYYDSIVLKD